MVAHRLVLTSNGLTTPGLERELVRMLGDDAKSKTVWYIPTAPLRDGWSKGQAQSAMQGVQRQFGFGRIEWIDPEYIGGAELAAAVAELKPDVIWAEMGNTYNLCFHLWRSGGGDIILKLMDAGCIYVGSSAGAIPTSATG